MDKNAASPVPPAGTPIPPQQMPGSPPQAPVAPRQAPAAPMQAPVAFGQAPTMPGQVAVAPPQAPFVPGHMPVAPAPAPAQVPLAPNQAPFMPSQVQQQAPAPSASSEAFLGGKVVGIVAAILVLSGLVLLGATFIPQLPNLAKALFIFLFALALTAGGAILTTKSRNVFSYALLISGMAAFFVAIWVSWIHFNLFSHTTALVVSGLWMAVTLALLLFTRTWPLSVALCAAAGLFGISFLEGSWIRSWAYSAIDGYSPIFEPYMLAAFILLVVYILALGAVGIKLAHDTLAENASDALKVRQKCLASFFVAEGALFYAGLNSTWPHSAPVMFVLLAALFIAAQMAPLPAPLNRNQTAWRVNEIIIFALGSIGIAAAGEPNEATLASIILYGIFAIAAIVVTGLHARYRTQPGSVRPKPAIPVLIALTLSGVVITYICALAFPGASDYMWSAAGMLCALVAIGAGFWFGEKPLRLYGLIATLLFVLKIAIFDISGDALAHAVALVVAGLICFGISALYTYASKKLS